MAKITKAGRFPLVPIFAPPFTLVEQLTTSAAANLGDSFGTEWFFAIATSNRRIWQMTFAFACGTFHGVLV
jgi:hypothetical protein